jgi:hypothetical protein
MDVGSPAATGIIGRMAAQIAPACSQLTSGRCLSGWGHQMSQAFTDLCNIYPCHNRDM